EGEVGERLKRSDISNFKVGDLKYSDDHVLANEPSQSLKEQIKKTTKKSSSTKKKSGPPTKKSVPTTKKNNSNNEGAISTNTTIHHYTKIYRRISR
uniref:BLVR domain-containing protein n=1 Tax=Parastrongyloides trichosuri TaxID=131310 RepID=A0A0N4ZXS8_PARTI